ncbi:MAG: alpha/beta fold hydrolase [Rhodobacteraceae bacterium]|nr:alpha/beta fold hydrolase [Paracoccaceae bacterium]
MSPARRWLLLGGAAALLGILALGRARTPSRADPPAPDLPEDLDEYLAEAEARVPDLRAGAQKEILWADPATRDRTAVAIVYLHGFSASRLEISPVAERVARDLGANLFLTRLAGHGRNGAAMAEPRLADWLADLAEAVAIGRRIGDRIVLIGTSTGGTLAYVAAAMPALRRDLLGVALLSPNFALRASGEWLLRLPGARRILPLVGGRERGFEPRNAAHAAGWTTRYSTASLATLGDLLALARRIPPEDLHLPAFFAFSPEDSVVDPAAIERIAARWGGPTEVHEVTLGPDDDPSRHVIAGDILSPGMTDAMVGWLAGWIRRLEQQPDDDQREAEGGGAD